MPSEIIRAYLVLITSPNEHEDLDQHLSYKIPSKTMPCYSYPASLVDPHSNILSMNRVNELFWHKLCITSMNT